MNREQAIAIIRKEYLCVDRDCDIEKNCGKCDLMMPNKEPILEAYKMAIKALECDYKADYEQVRWERDVAIAQLKELGYEFGEKIRTDGDTISRQAVLDAIENEYKGKANEVLAHEIVNIMAIIDDIPPVNPTKTGHWIGEKAYPICSKCKCNIIEEYISYSDYAEMYKPMNYCPNCGAKMQEVEE